MIVHGIFRIVAGAGFTLIKGTLPKAITGPNSTGQSQTQSRYGEGLKTHFRRG